MIVDPYIISQHQHRPRREYHARVLTYAERIIPSEYVQRLKMETYRYRWYERNGTLGGFMQSIGNFGRKYFGFLDPRQTGCGWW